MLVSHRSNRRVHIVVVVVVPSPCAKPRWSAAAVLCGECFTVLSVFNADTTCLECRRRPMSCAGADGSTSSRGGSTVLRGCTVFSPFVDGGFSFR